MEEVGVQVDDGGAELMGEHQRLAEAPRPVGRRVALEVTEPGAPRRAIAWQVARPAPGAPNPERFAPEVFGQVGDGRPDLAVDWVAVRIARAPERDDRDVESAVLEGADFLGDEGLGKPRIALEDVGDRAAHLVTG